MYKYILKVGGKIIHVEGVNLKTAIEDEGFKILSMYQDNVRKPNGRCIVHCENNTTIFTEWTAKMKRLGTEPWEFIQKDEEKLDWFQIQEKIKLQCAMDNKPYHNVNSNY